jgi:hypothetical protein
VGQPGFVHELGDGEALDAGAADPRRGDVKDAVMARGARIGVRIASIALAAATRAKSEPYLASWSWIRNRGPAPSGVASRSC